LLHSRFTKPYPSAKYGEKELAWSGTVEGERFGLTLTLKDGYQMAVDFEQDGVADLLVDEPPPLGLRLGRRAGVRYSLIPTPRETARS
jgi:hypothetical protein